MNNQEEKNKVEPPPVAPQQQKVTDNEPLSIKPLSPTDAWRWDERVLPSRHDDDENKYRNTVSTSNKEENRSSASRRSQQQEQQQWSSNILSGSNTSNPLPPASRLPPAQTTSSEKQQRRTMLALFIKILLKILLDENEVLLHQQVRMVVSMVIRGHKLTALSDRPLEETIESHLRPLVGESHWEHARVLQKHYIRLRRHNSASAAACRTSRNSFNRYQQNAARQRQLQQQYYSIDPRTIVQI